MSFEYTDLVRDVSDRTADDYQEYLDNLEPDEDAQDPWEFASDESLHENIHWQRSYPNSRNLGGYHGALC